MTDANARVLNTRGEVIPGLYAVGADMNSVVSGTYPGPGIVLGTGLTFGYIAAQSIVDRKIGGKLSHGLHGLHRKSV
jgi:hypothetical protein